MANNFRINKRGVKQLTDELQREFAKHPIKVPLAAASSDIPVASSGDTYNAPVLHITGDGAQIAWGNETVNQTNSVAKQEVAPGFEEIGAALTEILRDITESGLPAEEVSEVQEAGRTALEEVVKENPDQGIIKRSVTTIKGVLASLAVGAQDGASEAVHNATQDWAKTAIKMLAAAAVF